METNGPVSAAEASAALASVERSRTRVAWAGYPRWYWFAAGAGIGLLPLSGVLPTWLGVSAFVTALAVLLWLVHFASRIRGVSEYPLRGVMRWRELLLLYGPTNLVLYAGSFMEKFLWWAPIASAVLIFVLFSGTGLWLSARAALP